MMDAYTLLKNFLSHPILGFGGADPPKVTNINTTAGEDANAAKAAADAAELERKKLEKERGQAATVLGGKDLGNKTEGKPTLLSGIK